MRSHMCVCVCVCVCVCACVYAHACMCACMSACACEQDCVSECMCMCVFVCHLQYHSSDDDPHCQLSITGRAKEEGFTKLEDFTSLPSSDKTSRYSSTSMNDCNTTSSHKPSKSFATK